MKNRTLSLLVPALLLAGGVRAQTAPAQADAAATDDVVVLSPF
jgi:hypothetical protein